MKPIFKFDKNNSHLLTESEGNLHWGRLAWDGGSMDQVQQQTKL